jgi:hypothetical protein
MKPSVVVRNFLRVSVFEANFSTKPMHKWIEFFLFSCHCACLIASSIISHPLCVVIFNLTNAVDPKFIAATTGLIVLPAFRARIPCDRDGWSLFLRVRLIRDISYFGLKILSERLVAMVLLKMEGEAAACGRRTVKSEIGTRSENPKRAVDCWKI